MSKISDLVFHYCKVDDDELVDRIDEIMDGDWDAKVIATSSFLVASAIDWTSGRFEVSDRAKDEGWTVQYNLLGIRCPYIKAPQTETMFIWTTRGLFTAIGSVGFIDMYDTANGPLAVYVA